MITETIDLVSRSSCCAGCQARIGPETIIAPWFEEAKDVGRRLLIVTYYHPRCLPAEGPTS